MDIRRRNIWAARVLLSVFVPMLLLSALHTHQKAQSAADSCSECVNHIPHAGHFSIPVTHTDDCVLCQFASLQYVATAITVVAALVVSHKRQSVVSRTARCLQGIRRAGSPRAPPIC